jgi:hypothetical protein
MPLTEDKKHYIINSAAEITKCGQWVRGLFDEHHYLVISAKTGKDRTLDQNNKLWPMLTDISLQVEWFGKKHGAETWKDIITGSFKRAEFVPNIDGTGFVVLGMRTSKMDRKTFAELVEYIYAFGADKGVKWSEKSEANVKEIRGEIKC